MKGMDSGADAERAILLKETERLNRAAAANARLASLLKTAQHEHYYERERLLSEHASRLREGGSSERWSKLVASEEHTMGLPPEKTQSAVR